MKKTKRVLFFAAVFLSLGLSQFILKANAEAPEMPAIPKEKTVHQAIAEFAALYGSSAPVLEKVMECESGGMQETKGDHGQSLGVFQIQPDTWRRFTSEMGATLDIASPADQAQVAAWAFAHGHGDEWTTYVAIRKGGSYTFWYRLEDRYFTVHCKL